MKVGTNDMDIIKSPSKYSRATSYGAAGFIKSIDCEAKLLLVWLFWWSASREV